MCCFALVYSVPLFQAYAKLGQQDIEAAFPDKMSYQAVIRNNDNQLVINQNVGVMIRILKGSTIGAAVYSETQIPMTNANGLVSIEIGGGTSSDNFSTIDWSDGPYYLKTEIDPAGGTNYTITGVSQLLSVPYALYANRVKSPEKVIFHVYRDNDMDISTNTETKMNFNQQIFNVGNYFNLSTDMFTAPVSGYYVFTAYLELLSPGTEDFYFEMYLKINGGVKYQLDRELVNDIGTMNEAATGSVVVHLLKGNTIALFAKSVELDGKITNINYLCGYLISADE